MKMSGRSTPHPPIIHLSLIVYEEKLVYTKAMNEVCNGTGNHHTTIKSSFVTC